MQLVKGTADTKKAAENDTNTENFARNNILPSALRSQESGIQEQAATMNAILMKLTAQDSERAAYKKQMFDNNEKLLNSIFSVESKLLGVKEGLVKDINATQDMVAEIKTNTTTKLNE